MSIMPFTPCPATGAAFIGREGLVRNLRARIAKGESLAVIGGPKLGKTSLVRTALNGLLDRTVIERDLGADPSPGFEMVPGSIVVLDNLDAIWTPSQIQRSNPCSHVCRRREHPASWSPVGGDCGRCWVTPGQEAA